MLCGSMHATACMPCKTMLVHSARRLWVIELLCMTATLPTTMIVRGHLGSSAKFACEGRLIMPRKGGYAYMAEWRKYVLLYLSC